MVKQSIESGVLFGQAAVKPLADLFRAVKTPTTPLLEELVKFVKNLKSLESRNQSTR
jgi:hypothetical protein